MRRRSNPQLEADHGSFAKHYFVLARKQGKFFPLGKMSGGGLLEGKLVIDLESESQNVLVRMTLDFVNERLLFDPLRDVGFRQDRNSRASILEELAVLAFLWCMYCNGRIEVWDETGERRMAMSQPCILTNMDLNPAGRRRMVDELTALLDQFPPDEPAT